MQPRPPPFRRDEVQHLVDVEDRVQQLGDHMARAVVGHRQILGQHVLDQPAVDDDALFLAQLFDRCAARCCWPELDPLARGLDECLLELEPRRLVELRRFQLVLSRHLAR